MSFLKKGPELKPSELKVPTFLQDIYWDLKDRHLLPVAVILLVAIAAVPVAISRSSDPEEPVTGAAPEAGASQSSLSPTGGALVAESAPGLRDYKRRLDHHRAADPFKSKVEQPEKSASGSSGGASEGTAGSSPPTESAPSTETSSSTEPTGPTGVPSFEPDDDEGPTRSRLIHYSYAIDVRISAGSGKEKKSTVRRNLPQLTMLPSRKTPALVYMGSTKDGEKAVMTVSSDVQGIFGDAKCLLGSETCQLLMLEVGLPVTFVYGGAARTYKIELLKVELVESDELNKAALGNPKQGQNSEKGQKGD